MVVVVVVKVVKEGDGYKGWAAPLASRRALRSDTKGERALRLLSLYYYTTSAEILDTVEKRLLSSCLSKIKTDPTFETEKGLAEALRCSLPRLGWTTRASRARRAGSGCLLGRLHACQGRCQASTSLSYFWLPARFVEGQLAVGRVRACPPYLAPTQSATICMSVSARASEGAESKRGFESTLITRSSAVMIRPHQGTAAVLEVSALRHVQSSLSPTTEKRDLHVRRRRKGPRCEL